MFPLHTNCRIAHTYCNCTYQLQLLLGFLFSQRGFVLGFCNFAWDFKSQIWTVVPLVAAPLIFASLCRIGTCISDDMTPSFHEFFGIVYSDLGIQSDHVYGLISCLMTWDMGNNSNLELKHTKKSGIGSCITQRWTCTASSRGEVHSSCDTIKGLRVLVFTSSIAAPDQGAL
jgi:hypothetical protein